MILNSLVWCPIRWETLDSRYFICSFPAAAPPPLLTSNNRILQAPRQSTRSSKNTDIHVQTPGPGGLEKESRVLCFYANIHHDPASQECPLCTVLRFFYKAVHSEWTSVSPARNNKPISNRKWSFWALGCRDVMQAASVLNNRSWWLRFSL